MFVLGRMVAVAALGLLVCICLTSCGVSARPSAFSSDSRIRAVAVCPNGYRQIIFPKMSGKSADGADIGRRWAEEYESRRASTAFKGMFFCVDHTATAAPYCCVRVIDQTRSADAQDMQLQQDRRGPFPGPQYGDNYPKSRKYVPYRGRPASYYPTAAGRRAPLGTPSPRCLCGTPGCRCSIYSNSIYGY